MSDRSGPIFLCKVAIGPGGPDQRIDDAQRILDWSHESTHDGKSDKLSLTVDNFDLANFDDPVWALGNVVVYQYGYAGNMCPSRRATIKAITGFHQLKIDALGGLFVMNTITKTRTFENMKRSDVVKQIAGEYNLQGAAVDIDDTKEAIPVIIQARMTDQAFLRDLAQREGFEFGMNGRGLYFRALRKNITPVRKLSWYVDPTGGKDPDAGSILGWPSVTYTNAGAPSTIVATGLDSQTKQKLVASASNDTDNGRDGLAPVVPPSAVLVDGPTGAIKPVGSPTPGAPTPSGTSRAVSIATTEKTQTTTQRQVDGMFQRLSLGTVKLALAVVGDPNLQPAQVIEMSGLGRTLSGNYYVHKVRQKGGSGGYTTDLELGRDGISAKQGTNTAGANSTANVNTQEGPPAPSNDLRAVTVEGPTGEVRTLYVEK